MTLLQPLTVTQTGAVISRPMQVKLAEVQRTITDHYDPNDGADWTNAFARASQAMIDNSQCGSIVVPDNGTNYLHRGILLRAKQSIRGNSRGTANAALKLIAGTTGPAVSLYSTNEYQCGVYDLDIIGTQDASSTNEHGIHFDNTGITGSPGYDSRHRVQNVNIRHLGGRGLWMGIQTIECLLEGVWAGDCKDHNVYLECTDSNIIGVTSAGGSVSGGGDFYSTGANNRLVGCKAYGSPGVGMNVRGSRDSYVGCQAQDNVLDGWYIPSGANGINMAACTADSCGRFSFNFDGCSKVAATALQGLVRSGGLYTPTAHFNFQNGAANNFVTGQGGGGPTVLTGANSTDGSNIINVGTTPQLRTCYGVPSNSLGGNGDFMFRQDTPGTANQRIYVKSGGVWVGIL